MALLRTVLTSGSRIISRNIRMSANLREKAAEAMEKLKEGNLINFKHISVPIILIFYRESVLRKVC